MTEKDTKLAAAEVETAPQEPKAEAPAPKPKQPAEAPKQAAEPFELPEVYPAYIYDCPGGVAASWGKKDGWRPAHKDASLELEIKSAPKKLDSLPRKARYYGWVKDGIFYIHDIRVEGQAPSLSNRRVSLGGLPALIDSLKELKTPYDFRVNIPAYVGDRGGAQNVAANMKNPRVFENWGRED